MWLCKGKEPEPALLSKLSVPLRHHPLPLLAADTLLRNGALSEENLLFRSGHEAWRLLCLRRVSERGATGICAAGWLLQTGQS